MPRHPRKVIEYHNYALPPEFPIAFLTGDTCRISDIRPPALHFHSYLEIGLCHSDSGILEFLDAGYPFKAGDVTLVSRSVPHTAYSSPGTASSWSYLIVDLVQMLDPLAAKTDMPPEVKYENLLYNSRLILSKEQDAIPSLLVSAIIQEIQGQKSNYKHCVRCLLGALLSRLARYTNEAALVHTHQMLPITEAVRYIDTHYQDAFKVDDLAVLCNMSSSYFRRIFTETMGHGPLEYLNRIRIMRACALLQVTNYSVSEVCEEVGFGSLSSFNRHFFAIMGQPPTSWRHHMHAN